MGQSFDYEKSGAGCNVYVTVNCCETAGCPHDKEPFDKKADSEEKKEKPEKREPEPECGKMEHECAPAPLKMNFDLDGFRWPSFVTRIVTEVIPDEPCHKKEEEDCDDDKKKDKDGKDKKDWQRGWA